MNRRYDAEKSGVTISVLTLLASASRAPRMSRRRRSGGAPMARMKRWGHGGAGADDVTMAWRWEELTRSGAIGWLSRGEI
jgi:hypothetical protein